MVTEISTELLRDLFAAAKRFHTLAPWNWLEDEQLFGLVHPSSGEKGYCSIMGNLGDYFALGLYVGAEGYRSLMRLSDEENADDYEESIYHQQCVICAFEDEGDLDPDDLDLIKHVGIEFSGEKAFPTFRSYKVGYMPWAISTAEAEWMLLALEQATQVGIATRDNPELIKGGGLDVGSKILFRVPAANGTVTWSNQFLETDNKFNLSPPQLTIPLGEIAPLKQLPRHDSIWLFEQFFLNLPSMDGVEDRPFFPKALVLLDVEDQTIAGMEALKPNAIDEDAATMITEAFRERNILPAQIVVANRENYILLKSFCKALNIDLYLDAEMNLIPELRESLMETLGVGDEDDED